METKLMLFFVILAVFSIINADETSSVIMETTPSMEQLNTVTNSVDTSQSDTQPVNIETKNDEQTTTIMATEEEKLQKDQPEPDASSSTNEVTPMMKNSQQHMETETEMPTLTQTTVLPKAVTIEITTISTPKQKQQPQSVTPEPQKNSAIKNSIKSFIVLIVTFSLFYI
ncbi:hypothetical protein PVAND_000729 [Polypedilum vanderplanki]|uniref:Uncharacterized protein n=1 Tax=Polypedilum vanderplanki TaxID=319348 RepID=A0A9J6BL24_POLVA|nr:hypothetical protein PVAND_000729 [Polypedilum vanderplanki]